MLGPSVMRRRPGAKELPGRSGDGGYLNFQQSARAQRFDRRHQDSGSSGPSYVDIEVGQASGPPIENYGYLNSETDGAISVRGEPYSVYECDSGDDQGIQSVREYFQGNRSSTSTVKALRRGRCPARAISYRIGENRSATALDLPDAATLRCVAPESSLPALFDCHLLIWIESATARESRPLLRRSAVLAWSRQIRGRRLGKAFPNAGVSNYSAFLLPCVFRSGMIGANMRGKRFVALQFEFAHHFIEGFAGWRLRRVEDPSALGATPTSKTLLFNPYLLPADGGPGSCDPSLPELMP